MLLTIHVSLLVINFTFLYLQCTQTVNGGEEEYTSNGDWRRKQSKRKNVSVTEKCFLIDPHDFLLFLLNPVDKLPQVKDP